MWTFGVASLTFLWGPQHLTCITFEPCYHFLLELQLVMYWIHLFVSAFAQEL